MKTTVSTIKCTYQQLATLRDQQDREDRLVPGPISKLAKVDESQVPSIKDRIRIGHFIRAVVSEANRYEKTHAEILKKYGTLTDTTPPRYLIAPDKQADYRSEMQKLDSTETEVAAFPLPATMLERVSLSVGDLGALEPFITLTGDSDETSNVTPFDKRQKIR